MSIRDLPRKVFARIIHFAIDEEATILEADFRLDSPEMSPMNLLLTNTKFYKATRKYLYRKSELQVRLEGCFICDDIESVDKCEHSYTARGADFKFPFHRFKRIHIKAFPPRAALPDNNIHWRLNWISYLLERRNIEHGYLPKLKITLLPVEEDHEWENDLIATARGRLWTVFDVCYLIRNFSWYNVEKSCGLMDLFDFGEIACCLPHGKDTQLSAHDIWHVMNLCLHRSILDKLAPFCNLVEDIDMLASANRPLSKKTDEDKKKSRTEHDLLLKFDLQGAVEIIKAHDIVEEQSGGLLWREFSLYYRNFTFKPTMVNHSSGGVLAFQMRQMMPLLDPRREHMYDLMEQYIFEQYLLDPWLESCHSGENGRLKQKLTKIWITFQDVVFPFDLAEVRGLYRDWYDEFTIFRERVRAAAEAGTIKSSWYLEMLKPDKWSD